MHLFENRMSFYILHWDAIHMEILRRMLKRNVQCSKLGFNVYSEEMHLYDKVECTSTQTVQSKVVFIQRRCSI